MAWYNWSQTAATNATADTSINWAEGQAPSSVNDSARAMMAASAKYRDDIAGAILTTGTSTAYAVTSYSVFDTLAHMANQMIAFTPHATNGATVTLNVDSLGAKPLRSAPSTELLAGTLILGTPYVAVYNNSDAVWYLQGFFGNPYNIPLAGGLPFFGSTAPNSSFVFPYGQAISQTTYASLYALLGNTYGTATGGLFYLPDLRGRVIAGKDDMGGTAAGLFTGVGFSSGNATTLGSKLGIVTQTLSASHLPPHTHSGNTGTESAFHTHNVAAPSSKTTGAVVNASASAFFWTGTGTDATSNEASFHTHPFTTDGGTGASAPFPTVQPTILTNYILRII